MLGIFPEDTQIPLSAAAQLWGVDEAEAEEVLRRLDDLALLRFDVSLMRFGFHDVVLDWLTRRATSGLHNRLLTAWGDLKTLPSEYAWRWLGYHLRKAGRSQEWDQLRQDFEWIRNKLLATDTVAIESDFEGETNPELRLISKALMQSSHVLQKDPSQLAWQMYGRLQGVKDLKD